MTNNNEKVVIYYCADCGTEGEENTRCCGDLMDSVEMTRGELRLIRMREKMHRENEDRKMAACGGSWDY